MNWKTATEGAEVTFQTRASVTGITQSSTVDSRVTRLWPTISHEELKIVKMRQNVIVSC